ncbi:hypothetical protein EYF80_037458 [Liparis tanakae]|uniref:Secreted protein n=1 Tax=Liparis tanakae TaxID=230148 RepID=A0A4Z2GHR8_9TELE|nr:hypothetical protein EYF80_037458 [Liparis tanakae]
MTWCLALPHFLRRRVLAAVSDSESAGPQGGVQPVAVGAVRQVLLTRYLLDTVDTSMDLTSLSISAINMASCASFTSPLLGLKSRWVLATHRGRPFAFTTAPWVTAGRSSSTTATLCRSSSSTSGL